MSSASSEIPGHESEQQTQQQQQQFVCVKRPDASLSAIFEHMYVNERLVDVTLSCSNGQLQAHKLVLAACSPYFSDLFGKLANPFHYPVVVVKDVRIEDLRMLVDYMYRGQLTIDQERLPDLVKCAENLQITGLNSLDTLITTPVDKNDINHTLTINVEGPKRPPTVSPCHRSHGKRAKRSTAGYLNYGMIGRTYHRSQTLDDHDDRPSPGHLLEQSIVTTNDTLDGTSFNGTTYALTTSSNHPTSAKNLMATNNPLNQTTTHQQIQQNSVSSLQHIQHHLGIDNHQNGNNQQQNNHNLTNQLQVLSHSLVANRTSLSMHGTGAANSHLSSQLSASHHTSSSSSSVRGRLHPCNICWKTFREKANLKRHLQVHSIDRVVYACPDCNKTFSWKDNYIRHTKTAHHMNNVTRQQAS